MADFYDDEIETLPNLYQPEGTFPSPLWTFTGGRNHELISLLSFRLVPLAFCLDSRSGFLDLGVYRRALGGQQAMEDKSSAAVDALQQHDALQQQVPEDVIKFIVGFARAGQSFGRLIESGGGFPDGDRMSSRGHCVGSGGLRTEARMEGVVLASFRPADRLATSLARGPGTCG
jgi:hypothetical protein